jgi:hypothetical protein
VVAALHQVHHQRDAEGQPFGFPCTFGDIPGEVTGILQ